MTALPSGTVTFLFTDLEGSTRLWQEHPEAMPSALARHDEIVRTAIDEHGGVVVKTTGDGAHAVFADAHDAVSAAVAAQRALGAQSWDLAEPLKVRMGLHTGPAELRDGDYYGTAVNRAARVSAAAHGGQVVVSHATEEVARDHLVDVDLVDLGEHRLRDLARPERIFQVAAPGLEADFPPLRSLEAYPGNLPPQLTSFVGRDDDLAQVAAALGETRLVTMIGVGGVGKTRLATQVAADVLPRFPDGAWLCELAAAGDPAAMAQLVAATLGVQLHPNLSLAASILGFLRNKQLLVVLDNCEHLLDAAGDLAEGMLRECPGVRVLATSREPLAVLGEQVWPLRSLRSPAGGSVDEVATSTAGRLFAERAQGAAPGFAIDATNAAAVAEICRRLDGIPLALELAAARVTAMSPTEIARLLDERFRLLTGGRRTAVERHQTLRATVDWSYSLLDPVERRVFDRLGVFAGDFDGAAANAVVAGDDLEVWDVVDALASLVTKSMVNAEKAPDDTTRFSMLETLRHYAREQLDATGDADAWRRRHADHYAAFAIGLDAELRGPNEIAARERLRRDLDNLRAAVTWALDRDDPDDVELGVAIVADLHVQASNDVGSGIGEWAERAVPHARASTPTRRRAVLGAAAFTALQVRADLATGRALALEALRDPLTADPPMSTLADATLALVQQYAGELDAMRAHLGATQAQLDALGDHPYEQSMLHSGTSHLLGHFGDRAGARAEAEAALRIARRLRNPTALGNALFAVGWTFARDDPGVALPALDESIALARAGGYDAAYGTMLSVAAEIRARTGDLPGALRDLRDAFVRSAEIGDHMNFASAAMNGAVIAALVGGPELAAVLGGFSEDAPMGAMVLRHNPEDMVDELQRSQRDALVALGATEYEVERARGAAMGIDEVAAYAREAIDRILAEMPDEQVG